MQLRSLGILLMQQRSATQQCLKAERPVTYPSAVYPEEVKRSFWNTQWMGLATFKLWITSWAETSFRRMVFTTVLVMFWNTERRKHNLWTSVYLGTLQSYRLTSFKCLGILHSPSCKNQIKPLVSYLLYNETRKTHQPSSSSSVSSKREFLYFGMAWA